MDVLGGVLLVLGAGFVLLAGVGVVRFGDTFSRMHAAAKAPALGVIGLGLGAALSIGSAQAVVAAFLVVVLQLIAGPVAAHLLGRAVYRTARPALTGPDELAASDDESAGRA